MGCRVSRGAGAGCRVVRVLVNGRYWHYSGTGSDTGPGTVPALAWPTAISSPVYALVDTGVLRAPRVHPGTPCTPGTPCSTWHPRRAPGHDVHRARYTTRRPLGSLWAAPVDGLARLVTWPTNTRHHGPLIGTPMTAPCVTRVRAITASAGSYTLLWSTL